MSHDPRQGKTLQGASPAHRQPTPPPPPRSPSRPIGLPPGGPSTVMLGGKAAWQAADDEAPAHILRSASWLMSGVVHMLVLIALGLLYVTHTESTPREIEVVEHWSDRLGDPLNDDPFNYPSPEPEGDILSIHPGPLVDDPYSAPSAPQIQPLAGFGGAGGTAAPASATIFSAATSARVKPTSRRAAATRSPKMPCSAPSSGWPGSSGPTAPGLSPGLTLEAREPRSASAHGDGPSRLAGQRQHPSRGHLQRRGPQGQRLPHLAAASQRHVARR